MHPLSLVALLLVYSRLGQAADYQPQFWKNDEQGWVVEARECDHALCGYLVAYRTAHQHLPDFVLRDVKNPDPKRRDAPLCGLQLIGGFKPSARKDGMWDRGWVYDPDSGHTYSGTITQVDANTVKLRGYLGIPLFGRTITLHRVNDVPTGCGAAAQGH